MSAQLIIEAAAKLVKQQWTQGDYARNAKGVPVDFKRGKNFCVVGAILAQGSQSKRDMLRDGIGGQDVTKALGYVEDASKRLYKRSAYWVNDNLKHEDVLAVLRLAWKLSKEDQQ